MLLRLGKLFTVGAGSLALAGLVGSAGVVAPESVAQGVEAGGLAALARRTGRLLEPTWAGVTPRREQQLDYDHELGEGQNAAELARVVASLRPGDRLWIGAGIWSFKAAFEVNLVGTEDAPIWIEAREGEQVVITRANARQNVLNVGNPVRGPSRYLCLRGLELRGGSAGLRLLRCHEVWVDRCEIHHTGEAGLTANTEDTSRLFITSNHIHHTGGYGEGMYLGANNGQVVMSRSVIAANHVHHCGGKQGDGIEIKQGSWGNWIVGNEIHDTQYPCLLVYGTGGQPINVIERNVLYRSGTVVLQVQGEALVRNNLVVGGPIGFHSHDHQGRTVDLQLVHNTIVVSGVGVDLPSWNARAGMVLANNAIYTREGPAVAAEQGLQGVTIAGNVVLGAVEGVAREGFFSGRGLGDFLALGWDGSLRDPRPGPGSALVGRGDPRFAVWADLSGLERDEQIASGCAAPR